MTKRFGALLLVALATSVELAAQGVRGRLPLETFGMAQGLASDSVTRIVTDSRGFVWVATLDGLSRYDGTRFVSYSTDHGVPDRMIWNVAEDRRGAMWVSTHDGIAQMAPTVTRGGRLFTHVTVPGKTIDASVMAIDRAGTVWASCDIDLCSVRNGRLEMDTSFKRAGGSGVHSIASGLGGELWVGTHLGLFRRTTAGTWRRYVVQPHHGGDYVHGLLIDSRGRVWIGNGFGVVIFAPSAADDSDPRPLADRAGKSLRPGMALRLPQPGEVVSITVPAPSPIVRFTTPVLGRDGTVWVPSFVGLLRLGDGRVEFYNSRDGLPSVEITTVAEDPAGDLWIGTRGAGALRLARTGATSFTAVHGLANERITAVIPLADGSVCAANRQGISCFRETGITHGSMWPRGTQFLGWGWNQIIARDRDGTWWSPSGEGLIHWPATSRIEDLDKTKPLAIYTQRDGLDSDDVFRIWQDSRRRLWVSTTGRRSLSIRDPDTGRIQSYGDVFSQAAPTSFAEDRAGNVWIGLYTGLLVRYRNERFETITLKRPSGMVRDLKVDSSGRLWLASTGGVARIENPTADATALTIRRFTRADGLAADSGYCVVEMPDGRFAIASQRGLDVIDPRTGGIVHLTTREGLASNEVSVAAVDRAGALWLGTVNGLSRLAQVPRPRTIAAPQPRIVSIHIDGVAESVSELGTTSLSGVRIEYPRHTMAVGFSASHFDRGRPLRFQYRLNGTDRWTEAGSESSLVFDRLPSGGGLFELRTVTANGSTSAPATVSFTVVPAIWKRTWFLAMVAAAAMAIIFAAHRARVAHLVALERVRTRVATDLHDDLGTSLSRISILSEAAKQKADPAPILDEIADSARGLVDALGDSIWSIDPRRDDVQSLLQRVRHFATGVFEAQSTAIDVRLPADIASLRLRPEQRRETYLILKEALNNAAKHAGARQVSVVATTEGGLLRIAVKDDGRGIAERNGNGHRPDGGRGLPSMIDRARRAGGKVEIASEQGQGTRITVDIPL